MVVVGDSLSAGYMSGGLEEEGQLAGYAALVARQAAAPLSLPLIAYPGVPNIMELETWGPPPVFGAVAGQSSGRIDPFTQATDLAVPGHDVLDALEARPDFPIDSLTDLVLGLPGLLEGVSMSQVEWAEALEPGVILLWIGNNDILGAATSGSPELMTDPEVFEAAFGEIFDRLAATGAPIVVANIPDTTVIGYLTPVSELSWTLGVPIEILSQVLGVGADDYVTLPGLDLVGKILGGTMPGPLPDTAVLDAEETGQIRRRTELFNTFIAAKAEEHAAALVDIHGLLERADAGGVMACGKRLATHFLGGVFSLDGVHPTRTGYAVVANEFIAAINDTFQTALPMVDLCEVSATDPLLPPGLSFAPSALGAPDRGLLRPHP
ncbi:MAG: GDSL-type esterase/lipase family protein [Acidobacteriota bacterium]|nr:GDSL-type esterase/lipase family protein [Acidobacteriota bacterium]